MQKTLVVMVLVLLVACQPQTAHPETFDPAADLDVSYFASETELLSFIEDHQGSGGHVAEMLVTRTFDAIAVQEAAAPDFSETNVQVAGIDEADTLKTDGTYIYTITDDTVFVIDAYPGEDASVIAEIEYESHPSGLFLEGNHLAVFGNFHNNDWFKQHDIMPRSGMTFFDVYDVSDPENPKLVQEYKFEGSYFQGRMMDGWTYIVVRSYPEVRPTPMPLIAEGDEVTSVSVRDIAYYTLPYDNVEFATVHAINMETDTRTSKTVAVDGAQHLYMSYENIYITSTEYVSEWSIRQDIQMEFLEPELTASDKDLIVKIENTDASILTKNEKRSKIYNIYSRYMQFMIEEERSEFDERVELELKERLSEYEAHQYTVLHKMAVDEGTIRVGASGKVPGTIINQFALDEHDGVFRVATTIAGNWWWAEPATDVLNDVEIAAPVRQRTESVNNVYTLDENLVILDSLTGLAEGERIFSARFMEERLYLVTFRQVDPFFVIDLSNPENIENLGELKIPGFSRYLHPYDENHIIGIGRDATETGRQEGIKVSLFDVSDAENPKEVAQWVANEKYSQSAAEWEHKAFLFSREKNLLVIPAYSYGEEDTYNGAMVFHIDEEDIEMRGIIDHSDGKQRWSPQVERSLYIGDLLYTKSPYLLRINEIDDLSSVESVELVADGKAPYPIY